MSTTEKVGKLSQNAWSRTKTAIARTKQKAMVALGKADETVDISFNQQKEIFDSNHKAIKQLNKDASKLLDILKELSIAEAALTDDLIEIFDGEGEGAGISAKSQEIAKGIDASRQQIEETMKGDFIDPVSKYIGQYKDIKNRIETLNTRRVDMDRYSRDLRSHQEKAKNDKAALTQQKFDTAKANYIALHEELMKDLPLLLDDRIPFFTPVLATYLLGISEYYRQCSTQWSTINSLVTHIDRSAAAAHPRITTSPESSSATHKMTAAYVPSSTAYEPPSTYVSPSAPPATTTQMNSVPSLPPNPNRASLMGVKAQGVYDFNPQDDTELGFRVGEVITILKQNGDWWEGELRGKRGLLPSNYVKLM